jgi:hypothetical protein
LTLRWLTGLVGLAGVAGVMTYPARKTVYRRRAGALRYWLLAHVYLGIIAAVVLLIHGGSHGGGLLTLVLMLWFDATILTGLFGVACYVLVPRIMTSIEGDPLLIEDLEGRRQNCGPNSKRSTAPVTPTRAQLIDQKIKKHFFSISYLLSNTLGVRS